MKTGGGPPTQVNARHNPEPEPMNGCRFPEN